MSVRRQEILDDLAIYWEELRAGRLAPRRSDIDPGRFGPALEHMFIVETVAGGPMRLRLAGAQLCDVLGMEARGMPAHTLFTEAARGRADDLLAEVLEHPACIDLALIAQGEDEARIEGGMMLRPLADDFGGLTRILGCLVMDAAPFSGPLQMEIETIRIDTLSERRRRHQPMHGFAEAQASFSGPHLRSVNGGSPRGADERAPISRAHLRVVSSRD
ncbi:PAS domain-containing protein [Roseobacter sp. HKCCA0434]|uniref:PAS domain-containing protein n=1 Tax=Roseobacter sp. HKCCA0434 TaxID=3079297 RepID=UPI0029058248|nr:PAS domain-containing protein [Roseobacter sp. HKCCA0434]